MNANKVAAVAASALVAATIGAGVTAGTGAAPIPPPEAKALPAIYDTSGSLLSVGDSLLATTGSWVSVGNLKPYPNTSYSYQWKRCNSAGASCSTVPGATTNTYTIASSDQGSTMRNVVTATNAGGSTASTSTASGLIPLSAIGTTVNPAPLGPPTPNSGWSIQYADAFGSPLIDQGPSNGTATGSNDLGWMLDQDCNQPANSDTSCEANNLLGDSNGYNKDELQTFNKSQISIQSDGLHITTAYSPNRAPATGGYPVRNYVGGQISNPQPSGFHWRPGGGEQWAFEIVSKFAPNFDGGPTNGGNDDTFWSSDAGCSAALGSPPNGCFTTNGDSWNDEFDFYEHFGWVGPPSITGNVWVYSTTVANGGFHVAESDMGLSTFCGCDPSASFHRYTTYIGADNTFSFYMDGQQVASHAAPPSFIREWMDLIVSYGLRNPSGANPIAGFSTGSRDYTVRSVAVYENTFFSGQDVQNPGVAAGTTVGLGTTRRLRTARPSKTLRFRHAVK